jgi:hypothetical protein
MISKNLCRKMKKRAQLQRLKNISNREQFGILKKKEKVIAVIEKMRSKLQDLREMTKYSKC